MNNQKRTFPIFLLFFLVSTSLGIQAQKSQEVSTQMQVPPPRIILCPDINVISLTAKLVKTSVSTDGTQWDHVRLEATLQNDGGMAIPSGTMLQSKLYRNEMVLYYVGNGANGVKAPGSQWTDINDVAFRHGVKTTFTYAFLNIRDMKECKTTNNQAAITINEAALHANVILRR
jgi:hypothetical protein